MEKTDEKVLLSKVMCKKGDAEMKEKEIFDDVVKCMFEKLAALENQRVKTLITDVLNYIKNTGSTFFISYKPEVVELMKEHWQFFSLIGDSDKCRFRRNLCITVKFAEDGSYCAWVFDSQLVSHLSGLSLDIIEATTKKDEQLLLRPEPSVHSIVYLLRFYNKEYRLLPYVMVFKSEDAARKAASEIGIKFMGSCQYEIVSVEVSD